MVSGEEAGRIRTQKIEECLEDASFSSSEKELATKQ